jgi:hypothetical protein
MPRDGQLTMLVVVMVLSNHGFKAPENHLLQEQKEFG